MPTRVVVQGETVPRIAAEEGFGRAADIWNHPNNAALKQAREPCILAPGDQLFVPQRQQKFVSLQTGQRHTLIVQRPSLSVRLTLQECFGQARANASGAFECDGQRQRIEADADGKLEQKLPVTADVATLTFGDGDAIAMLIGHLDPIETVSGWRARLANLGYPVDFGGTAHADEAAQADAAEGEGDTALALAIEEFQLESGLKVTGKRDEVTQAKLKQLHGC